MCDSRSGFSEGKAVELALADFACGDVLHFRRDKINGAADLFRTQGKTAANDGCALVGVSHGAFGFIDDDDLCAWLGYPDHFFDRTDLVGEVVNATDVEDAIECGDLEGEAFGLSLKEVSFAAPLQQVALAFVKHSPGDVDPIELDVVRKEAKVCSCSY